MPELLSKTSDVKIKYTEIFINNEWHKATNGKTCAVINPSTDEEICRVQEGTKNDIDKAVEAAKQAFHINSPWRKLKPAARANLIRKRHLIVRNRWRNHRKMIIQLLSVSSLLIVFYFPLSVLFLARLCGLPPSYDAVFGQYGYFFSYAISLFIPFACLSSLPEVYKKLTKAFHP